MSAAFETPAGLQASLRETLLRAQVDYLRRELDFVTRAGRRRRLALPLMAVALAAALRARFSGDAEPPVSIAPARPLAPPAARRILVDVSETCLSQNRTGIQRVVREMTRALVAVAPPGAVVPVRRDGERLRAVVLGELGEGPFVEGPPVAIASGDALLMLDSSWHTYDDFLPAFDAVRRQGGMVATAIYDLVPELCPGACDIGMPEIHAAWLRRAIAESDALIAISATVAQDVRGFIAAERLPCRPGLRIDHVHCGCDIAPARDDAPAAEDLKRMFDGGAPAFVAVGTVEPRKGYATLLSAFDRLWLEGSDVRLVILGKPGWRNAALCHDIRNHPERGRRLMWREDASDADVCFAYDNGAALVSASWSEGFGLPVAEAARAGMPAIVSDIPIFREVAGEGGLFFPLGDAAALADRVRRFAAGAIDGDPSTALCGAWSEAAARLLGLMRAGDALSPQAPSVRAG